MIVTLECDQHGKLLMSCNLTVPVQLRFVPVLNLMLVVSCAVAYLSFDFRGRFSSLVKNIFYIFENHWHFMSINRCTEIIGT